MSRTYPVKGREITCVNCGELRPFHAKERCKKCYYQYKYQNNKDSYKNSALKKYGITLEQYNAQLEYQHGLCAICGTDEQDKFSFSVDHDHATGEVRGLLCGACNFVLGQAKDDIRILARSIAYLEGGGVWH